VGKAALVVMMKYPRPGAVKTRLVPPLTSEEAASLYRCFLKDTFGRITPLKGIDPFAAYTQASEEEVRALVPEGISIFEQAGGGLGERMSDAFMRLFSAGYNRVSMIGSDTPDLPIAFISGSILALDGSDVVFGPAMDGGYYLIALKGPAGCLFSDIIWGSSSVLDDSIARARQASLKCALLDTWHDIDRAEDLKYLKDNPEAPSSAGFLRELEL